MHVCSMASGFGLADLSIKSKLCSHASLCSAAATRRLAPGNFLTIAGNRAVCVPVGLMDLSQDRVHHWSKCCHTFLGSKVLQQG